MSGLTEAELRYMEQSPALHDVPRLVAEIKALRTALEAETLLLARFTDYAIKAGGWRLFYYTDAELPDGLVDLSDRFNPDLSERLRAALDDRSPGGAEA